MKRITQALAAGLIVALSACTGGPSAQPAPLAPINVPQGGAILVGVGDSLTAGYQSSGFLGDPTVTNPLSSYPGNAVPPGQESGFWADMYNQMTGIPNSAAQALPLIKGPGLANQIVINAATLFAPTHSSCDAFNDAAYSSSAWASTRMFPSVNPLDLGVPGITMHEAIAMKAPLTGPPNAANCGFTTIATDPTSGGLQSLVNGESLMFYPVLGSYQASLGNNLTELNVAVALHPQLTTVWLGANDLLKFTFSGGTFNPTKGNPITDSPTQLAADLTQIVTALKAVGSKVLVADLPNVLSTPQFFPQSKLSADLQSLGIPAAAAGAIVNYVGTQYGVTAGGYLTESGFLAIVTNCQTSPATCITPQLDPTVAGSGLGANYINPALAAEVAALNTGYNTAIDQIAASSGSSVALVPITTTFNTLATTGYTVVGTPFPPLTLQFGGGLLSWDGLHPSNVGYAVIANTFIQTADTAFGLTIPQISASQMATIAINDPYNSYAIKSVNPAFPLPLP